MFSVQSRFRSKSFAALAGLVFLSGCLSGGSMPNVDKTATGCSTGAALIGIRDGLSQTICGCNEGVTQISPGTDLVCTVPRGTMVVFDFSSNLNAHQVISDGVPSFVSSPPSIPDNNGGLEIHAHSVVIITPGTYRYYDAFNSIQSGRIIVQ